MKRQSRSGRIQTSSSARHSRVLKALRYSLVGTISLLGASLAGCAAESVSVEDVENLELAASSDNEAKAEAYCAQKEREGVNCKVIPARITGCGKGWIRGKKFKGKGKNYVACVQGSGRHVLKGIQPIQQTAVDQECEARKACVEDCSTQECRKDCRNSCKLEGCAPVAAAMLLSFWHGEGYDDLMLDSGYDGTDKPTKTVRELMKALKAMSFGDKGTATMAKFTKDGLTSWVKSQGYSDKLTVERMQAIRGHEKILQQVMKNVDEERPTILLFNEREASIDGACTDWHYVVAVGYDVRNPSDEKLLVLSGWEDGRRTETALKMVPVPFDGCDKKLNAGLIWIEEKE